MKVVVTGGTGFLGRALADALARAGCDVVLLTRAVPAGSVVRDTPSGSSRITRAGWTPDGGTGPWAATFDGADAVVNLAGESIAARRWSDAQKQRIRDSRVLATRSVVAAIHAAARPPAVLVNGSATGYYGDRGDERLTENALPGTGFLTEVCLDWEREAHRTASATTRVVCVRTGIVLERDGGALAKMLPPFKLFAGGPIGTGRQYMSWIHRNDWTDLVRWAIDTPAVADVINGTAPEPVTNAEFSKALGRALGRPSWLPAPGFALRLALGEMADALLLGGQRVLPAKPLDLGFRFRYPTIDQAFGAIFAD